MAENNDRPAEKSAAAPLEMRDAFGQALVELGNKYPQMLVLDADLHTSSKAGYFKKAFPDRFSQVGIAEQNLFGISAGLALTGFIPFPSTFAVFATRRALDQIAISICYPRLNVKIPGSYVGLPTSRAGTSHNCIEDIAVMRALPNMRVADPGDNADLRAIMHTAMETEGPVYFRIPRATLPDLFGANHRFEWGKGVVLRQGADVTLFSTGMMAHLCLEAARLLEAEAIQAEVVHLASIKPIDRDLIVESVHRTGCAVTAENATVMGGFGAAVSEVVGETYPVPVLRIGVQDRWVESGGTGELFTFHKMQPQDIAAAARTAIRSKTSRDVVYQNPAVEFTKQP
jgi:transketolase